MNRPVFSSNFASVALLAEGVDRNVCAVCTRYIVRMSPSSRRAWIEIYLNFCCFCLFSVVLLAEGVDRNSRTHTPAADLCRVALLAEGVDRNRCKNTTRNWHEAVALLAEGVDRNWPTALLRSFTDVALLAEGVDRN